jgi:hypothetical protein
MYPPREFYNPTDCVVWKLNKAIYGLRSGPSAWQKHLAEVLQQLGLIHNAAEPNIYMTATRDCYILVYVDGLLLLGQQQTVHNIFNQIQQHLLLRPTGTLHFGNTVSFLGRNITNRGDHFEISLSNDCIDKLPADNNMSTCNPAAAPGTASLKSTASAEHEQPLSTEKHAAFRKAVGKLQDDLHTARHLLRNKGVSKITHSTNNGRPTKAEASTTVLARYQTTQANHTTNNEDSSIGNTRPQRVRGQRLGRMFGNKEINNWLCDHATGNNHQLRQ